MLGVQQRPLGGPTIVLHTLHPNSEFTFVDAPFSGFVTVISGHTSLCGGLVLGIAGLHQDLKHLLLDAIASSPPRYSWEPW